MFLGNKKQYDIVCCENALKWIKNNIIPGEGIIVSSHERKCYPEVTGYTIPTLYQWGEKGLARNFVKWMIKYQNKDGSFSAPDGTPYTFDTGQVVRGFVAALGDVSGVEEPLIKACDWVCAQMQEDGRLSTPSTEMWGNIINDRIHLYVLSPLIEAGEKLDKPVYVDTAHKILNYYTKQEGLISFDTLSHFFAYIVEALCDLNAIDLSQKAMDQIASMQKKNGAIPAYKGVSWVCIPAVAQFAIVGYSLGMKEFSDKAAGYLQRQQTSRGGFYGSRGRGSNYFVKQEISWSTKFFLDVYHKRIQRSFDDQINEFLDVIPEDDERVQVLLSFLKTLQGNRVIDIGCGKGRFLRILQDKYPKAMLYGIDISRKMLKYCPKGVTVKWGNILDIRYSDNYFDGVYCIEILEHALIIENAIREMSRVLKSGGKILIIDKNKAKLGKLNIESWEQWFKPKEIIDLLAKYNIDATYKYLTNGNLKQSKDLFIAWEGIKK